MANPSMLDILLPTFILLVMGFFVGLLTTGNGFAAAVFAGVGAVIGAGLGASAPAGDRKKTTE